MTYSHLLVSADRPITTVTLNRVDQRNALALRELASGSARGIILAANGPVFSAGHDFADMAGATLEQARELF